MASITDSSQPVPSYEPKHMTRVIDFCICPNESVFVVIYSNSQQNHVMWLITMWLTDHFDFVNLLTYGMHGSWESKTGHHSLAYKISTDDREGTTNLEWVLDNWIALGADRSKLNIGTIFQLIVFMLCTYFWFVWTLKRSRFGRFWTFFCIGCPQRSWIWSTSHICYRPYTSKASWT